MNRGDVRIAQYENGSRTPKTGTLKRIAAALGVEPEELFCEDWYVKKRTKSRLKRGENCPEIPEQLPHITVERRANGNRRNYFQHTLFPKPYPLIRTNPARPYDKTTGHFHSGSLTFKMTEQKENERMCIQKEAHLHGYASLSCSCIV